MSTESTIALDAIVKKEHTKNKVYHNGLELASKEIRLV